MNLFSALSIQLVDVAHEPLPIPAVVIDVVFFCGGRERYRFDAGMTDPQGHLTVSYDFLENARTNNQAFALMDYNTALNDCDAVILLRAPAANELQLRLDALKKWFPERAISMSERFKSANNVKVRVTETRVPVGNGISPQVELITQL